MRKLIISEEERKSILSQHINEGHTVSEQAMGIAFGPETNGLKIQKQETVEEIENNDDIIEEMMVAFGDEMNGLKIKKEETIETVEDDDDIIEENMMVAFGDEMNGLKIKKEEPTEGVSDMVSGLKGVWRGEGYDYFKYLSTLKRYMNNLQKLDKPNQKIMNELSSLKNKITSSKMPPQKRDNLIRTIDAAIGHFNSYTNLVQQIGGLASQKLS